MAERQRMPVGIRFKEAGKIYYFDASGFELDVGNYVVVDTSHGREIGRVVIAPDQVIASEIKESLKPILRVADPEDLERSAELKKRAEGDLAEARRAAAEQDLDLRLVAGEYGLDGSQVTFYFTAEERSDFRTFARDLSTALNTKVQLLQVGDRDRAKMVGGIGRCGEMLCCASWLSVYPAVSMKQAKDQDLPLNPSKLSGACGRLLCCLTYEHEQYREIKGGLPKVGATVSTPSGDAKVIKINVIKETASMALVGTAERAEIPLAHLRLLFGTAVRPKELTETLEKELFARERRENGAPPRESGERTPSRERRESRPRRRASVSEQAEPAQQDGARPKRRRRRRGGRRQRRGGGGAGPSQ